MGIQAGCFGDIFKRRKHSHSVHSAPLNQTTETAKVDECNHSNPWCNYSYGPESDWWLHKDIPPVYSSQDEKAAKSAFVTIIDRKLEELDSELREISLRIHGHPELMFKEKFAHDLLTTFMSENGFKVTKGFLGLETAWCAEYTHGKGGRVLGINSEMDALSGIGHACGHNLIAVSGCGVAIAVKAALEANDIPGKIVLLGTPAEEGGGGKIILLERGGFKNMDLCLMCHPGPGPSHSTSVGSSNALQGVEVEYFGHSAHAGSAPWEGTNALDAAFLAYSSISVLRQQMKPDHRVHGVVHGRNWSPNVIPDYANMRWYIRAPTYAALSVFAERVKKCFEAAALATSCTLNMKFDKPYFDLNQNSVLAKEFSTTVEEHYGMLTSSEGTSASTDFGNVSYELPALHPAYSIPTEPNGGNHTPAFTKAAATKEAHMATMTVTKGLAMIGLRALQDDDFFIQVKEAFDSSIGKT